jgi:hypothetical protein
LSIKRANGVRKQRKNGKHCFYFLILRHGNNKENISEMVVVIEIMVQEAKKRKKEK